MTHTFEAPAFDVKGTAFLAKVERVLDAFADYAEERDFPRMQALRANGTLLLRRAGNCEYSVSDRDGQRRWLIDAFSRGYTIMFKRGK